MINLINEILNGLDDGSGRFEMTNHEEIYDTKTNLSFHLYDNKPFQITSNNERIEEMRDFNNEEQSIFQQIKTKLDTTLKENSRKKFEDLYRASSISHSPIPTP